MAAFNRLSFRYTPFYCEENVWYLAGDERVGGEARYVVFISNHDRTCPVWSQRAAVEPGRPTLWDYHVVYVVRSGGRALVYDLDTRLEFPCPLDRYLAESFPFDDRLDARLRPMFRVIDAGIFREVFASDRSHMMEDGNWKALPPSWPPIRTPSDTMNLDRFVDMKQPFAGEVMDRGALARYMDGG